MKTILILLSVLFIAQLINARLESNSDSKSSSTSEEIDTTKKPLAVSEIVENKWMEDGKRSKVDDDDDDDDNKPVYKFDENNNFAALLEATTTKSV